MTESRSAVESSDGGENRKVSQRSQIFAPKSGPPQVLLHNGKGNSSYRVCEDEPIHIPGAIQNFGALLGMKYNEGSLEVRIASENTRKVLGYGPEQLFALPSFLDVLKDNVRDELVGTLIVVLFFPWYQEPSSSQTARKRSSDVQKSSQQKDIQLPTFGSTPRLQHRCLKCILTCQ